MHPYPLVAGILERGLHLRILHDRAVRYRPVDLHEILIHDPAGTDVQVPHLRISHLSRRKADILAVRTELGMGITRLEGIEVFRMGTPHHISFGMIASAPTVEDHQQYLFIYFN